MAARRRRKQEVPDARTKILNAYLAFFESDNGKLVLADLKATYHDRSSVMVDFDRDRALVSESCRSVYLGIIAMIKEAKRDAAGNNDSRADTGSTFDIDAELDGFLDVRGQPLA